MLADSVLAGLPFGATLMNAAGTCKLWPDVDAFAQSAVGAVVLGSITLEPREGNPPPTYWRGETYSLNSSGLPNRGAEYYKGVLPDMVARVNDAGKALILSVAGFNRNEWGKLGRLAKDSEVDAVELNLSCPATGRVQSYDPETVAAAVYWTADGIDGACPLLVKLSYDPDSLRLQEVARIIATKPGVRGVVSINSSPNGAVLLEGGSALGTTMGGVSGAVLKPLAIGQILQLRGWLPESIVQIGCGGVTCGADIQDFLDAGAVAVQAATPYWNAGRNAGVYAQILQT